MVQALRQKITIGERGRVEIQSSDLPEGRTAEVIVLVDDAAPASTLPPLASYFGKAKGSFAGGEEADSFLRAERDEWDR